MISGVGLSPAMPSPTLRPTRQGGDLLRGAFSPAPSRASPHRVAADAPIQPWVLLAADAVDGSEVHLCDSATAGAFGNPYRSWLVIRNLQPARLDPARPAWNNRPSIRD